MKELKTLNDIRDYLESIPKEKWCKGTYGVEDVHCGVGWIAVAIKKRNVYARTLLYELGGKKLADEMENINDAEGDPKENVINYLNNKIKEQENGKRDNR